MIVSMLSVMGVPINKYILASAYAVGIIALAMTWYTSKRKK